MKKKPLPRRYDNKLREEQAEHTAQRILDAVHARLAKGDREVSYARVAREAKVSVPTVYRHFPTVEDIFRAYAAREEREYGEVTIDRATLPTVVRQFFKRFDDPDDLMNTAPRLNQMWQFSRVGSVPPRRAYFEVLLKECAPHLPAPLRLRFAEACTVTLSSAMGEALAGYFDLGGAAMADRVLLMLDALLAHAKHLSQQHHTNQKAR